MKISPQNQKLLSTIKIMISSFKAGVKRKAQGALIYDYLVPSGVYEEQWDWDGFFIGIALASEIPSEAIYLKNWVLNFLDNARKDGYAPGCITPKGRDERLNQMKPFLAQGAYFASSFLKDYSWLLPHLSKLQTIVLYREKNLWNKKYDLGVWFNSMESGADNNIAALNFPNNTVIGTDINSFIYREYKALSFILDKLGKKAKSESFKRRAAQIKNHINKYLWSEKDKSYYNMDSRSGDLIKRVSYNCIHPLWANIVPTNRAKKFITRYVLNPKKLWSSYGIRTLAKDDPEYNNANIIKPYSNWQGPIWIIANYFYLHALLNYGFQSEAINVARNIATLCLNDIKKTGGMHENYDAETGKPLAAPNFISWNLLVLVMLESAIKNKPLFSLQIGVETKNKKSRILVL